MLQSCNFGQLVSFFSFWFLICALYKHVSLVYGTVRPVCCCLCGKMYVYESKGINKSGRKLNLSCAPKMKKRLPHGCWAFVCAEWIRMLYTMYRSWELASGRLIINLVNKPKEQVWRLWPNGLYSKWKSERQNWKSMSIEAHPEHASAVIKAN